MTKRNIMRTTTHKRIVSVIILLLAGAAGFWVLHRPRVALPTKQWQSGGDFTYNSAPIDPLCIDALVNLADDAPSSIDLQTCGQGAGSEIHTGALSTDADGYYTDTYKDTQQNVQASFGSYKVVGSHGNTFLLLTRSSGGGTGIFESLLLVAKDTGNTLSLVRNISGVGDRCNGGGLTAALSADGSAVDLSSNVTAFDIVTLGTGEGVTDDTIQKYQDLDASAAGCYGTSSYQYMLDSGDMAFQSLKLDADASALDTDPAYAALHPVQSCFNKLFTQYIAKGMGTLAQPGLALFAQEFESECMK
jgi:hypothetical protein